MENAAGGIAIAAVIGLLIGLYGGYLFLQNEVEIEIPGETIEVPGEEVIVYVNQTVETEVEVMLDGEETWLNPALEDLFDEYDRDRDWLTCGDHEFDDSDVEASTVYEWAYTWLDNDEYEITGEFKFKADDDKDIRACKETRFFEVFYEDDEDPEFKWSREKAITA